MIHAYPILMVRRDSGIQSIILKCTGMAKPASLCHIEGKGAFLRPRLS